MLASPARLATVAMLATTLTSQPARADEFRLAPRSDDERAGGQLYGHLAVQGSGTAPDPAPHGGLSAGLSGQAWIRHITRALVIEQADTETADDHRAAPSVSVWPLFGMKWGLLAAGELHGHGWWCTACAPGALGAVAPLTAVQAGTWLVAETGIIDLWHRGAYGQPVSFSSPFWRPDRGLLKVGYGAGIPALIRVDSPDGWSFVVQSWDVHIEELFEPTSTGALGDHVGRDVSIRVSMGEYYRQRPDTPLSLRFLVTHVDINAVPVEPRWSSTEQPWAEQSSVALTVDMFDVRGASAGAGHMDVSLGLSMMKPSEVRDDEGSTSLAARGWIGYGRHRRVSTDRAFGPRTLSLHTAPMSFAVGAGTFHRLDPTGYGVDYGGQARAEVAMLLGEQWSAYTSVIGVAAWRVLVSDIAGNEINDTLGQRTLMGRAEIGASRPLRSRLHLSLTAWSEHSDRDIPALAARRPELGWDFGLGGSLTGRLF
jgi:hypothetical protein